MTSHQSLRKYFDLKHEIIHFDFLQFFQSSVHLVDHGCLDYHSVHGNYHFYFCLFLNLFLKLQLYNLGCLYFRDFKFRSLQCCSYHKMSLLSIIIINYASFGFIHTFKPENLSLILSTNLAKYLFNEYDAIQG
jgi:hypothetical protein